MSRNAHSRVQGTRVISMLAGLKELELNTYRYRKEFGGDDTVKLGFLAEDMPKEVLSIDEKGVDVYALLSYMIGESSPFLVETIHGPDRLSNFLLRRFRFRGLDLQFTLERLA